MVPLSLPFTDNLFFYTSFSASTESPALLLRGSCTGKGDKSSLGW